MNKAKDEDVKPVDPRQVPGVFEYDLQTVGVVKARGRGLSEFSGPIIMQAWLGYPHVAADPATTAAWGANEKGRAWFNSTENKFRFWDGTNVLTLMALAPGVVSLTEGAVPFGAVDGNLAENPAKLSWTEASTLLTADNVKVLTNLTLSTLTPNSIPYIGTSGLVSQNNAKLFWTNATTLLTVDNAKVLTNLTLSAFTAGSVPYIGTDGLVSQDSANLYWDATYKRLGIGGAPEVDFDLGKAAQATVVSRVSAKTRPWRQWECVDGNWGYSLGVEANDGKFYFNYESPIGTVLKTFLVIRYGGVGIYNILPQCDVIMPHDIALRWYDTDGVTPRNVLVHDVLGNIIIGVDGDDARVIVERLDTSTAVNTKYSSRPFELMANYWTGTAQQQRGVKFVNTMVTAGAAPRNQLKISIGTEYSETLILTLENDNETLKSYFEGNAVVLNKAAAQLQFVGTAGGGLEGITYKDSGSTNRLSLLFPGSDVVALVNRAANGTVQIRANTSTAGAGGELIVATFEDNIVYFNTGVNLGLGTTSFGTSAVGVFAIKTQTAPAGNVTDVFQMYSADFAAGNACPYFRTENGTVIGLNQGLLTTDSPTHVRLTLSQATGTAPLTITSTTVCTNLNADLLDGNHAAAFAAATHYHAFLSLTDTPANYTGSGSKVVAVNVAENALEFIEASGGVTAHGDLTGLDADDHTQYALLTGRDGGQILYGSSLSGENLYLRSTSHATKGRIYLDDSPQLVDTTTSELGVIYKGADRFIHNFHHPTGQAAIPIGRNTFVGVNAGNFTMGATATDVTHASSNIGIGVEVLVSNTLGSYNIAIGDRALYANTTGYNNIAFGQWALPSNTTGHNNFAMGTESLWVNTDGYYNVAIGPYTLWANTSGYNNFAMGLEAMLANLTGYNNFALGSHALRSNTTGIGNLGIGSDTLYFIETGTYNIAVGYRAGYGVAGGSGSYNTFISYRAGYSLTSGNNNIAIGADSLYLNATGNDNVAIGTGALKNVTNSTNIVAIGKYAALNLTGNQTGVTAIGFSCISQGATSSNCTAVGSEALCYNTGNNNSAFGVLAGYSNTGNDGLNAFGYSALYSNVGGWWNHAFGSFTLYANTSGKCNSAFGGRALRYNTTADHNSAFGIYAGYHLTTGGYNIHLGAWAGYGAVEANAPATDTYGILLGYNANRSVATATVLTNYIGIGYGVLIDKSNQVKIGNSSIVETQLYGYLHYSVPTTEPADADVGNGRMAAWLDEANTKIKFKIRDSGGNLKSAELAYA